MSRLFFITGMMRSGTAWASALISLCPNAFCYHEGGAQLKNGLVEGLRSRPEKFAGDSSPGWREFTREVDAVEAPRVAIIRSFDEVMPAIRKAFHGMVPNDWIHQDCERLNTWVSRHDPLVIPFRKLFTISGARQVWDHVLPGEDFPRDKVECLIRTRVEQILPEKRIMQELSDRDMI